MLSSLSSQNVIQYLLDKGLCGAEDGATYKSVLPENSKKNRNLMVILADNRQLLIKQECRINHDQIAHEFFNEWLFHRLLQQFPVIGNIGAIASSLLHFDEKNSILVRSYLGGISGLRKILSTEEYFP